ncbi:lycopene cyclase domain-containing protein [Kytococcus aerolatus]|uniref:Lycopene cyclase domain-containing protein n=1 Tax=Kytococcus aerolatus TaxID=592308 RepID=A0A212T1D7_9MICO|nr:lycopene cyclase domain-containing protein [Kytococcus aerolatus]SNC59862.1 lycopene cyclase domain-containing protein [Kytococcus aerolatus]
MTYLWVNFAVLVLVGAVSAVLWRGLGASARRRTLLLGAATLAISCVFTAVFDSLIIRAGIVGYDGAALAGWFVGTAPVEDFAYTVAAAVLLPVLWVRWGRSGGDES